MADEYEECSSRYAAVVRASICAEERGEIASDSVLQST